MNILDEGTQKSRGIEMEKLQLYSLKDFPGGSDGKASVYNAGDLGSILGSGRSPGDGNPIQYSCLEDSMNGGAW